MKLKSTLVLICLCLLNTVQSQNSKRPIGINLSRVASFSTESVFTDTFKQGRPWQTFDLNDPNIWDNQQLYTRTTNNNYPIQIPNVPANTITRKTGNTTVFGQQSGTRNLKAVPITVQEDSYIKSISIYHGGGTGNLQLAIYNGNQKPEKLLATTALTPVNTSRGWQTVSLPQWLAVTPTSNLWIAWGFEKNIATFYRSGTPGRYQISANWNGAMPANFGTGTLANYQYSVYANVVSKTASPKGARTILMTYPDNLSDHRGTYRLIIEGKGTFKMYGNGLQQVYTLEAPVDQEIQIDRTQSDGIVLEVLKTYDNAPITNISLVQPNYKNTFKNEVFDHHLLDFLKDFETIRYMDWLRTNVNKTKNWNDRPKKSDALQTTNKGVAWEYIIELSNKTNTNPWINIPHLASDDYIQQLALLFKNNLNSNLKIYLEYSNEIWNPIFANNQYGDVAELGKKEGYTGDDKNIRTRYTAKRSVDIFRIFEDVFGGSSRLIKVLPSNLYRPTFTKALIDHFVDSRINPKNGNRPNGVIANAVAIAPYFGITVADKMRGGPKTKEEALRLAKIEERDNRKLLTDHINEISFYGLKLLAYEGGQHLADSQKDEAIANAFISANRDPEMKSIYIDYFNYWYNLTGTGLFCHYYSHGRFTRDGNYGIKEYMDDYDSPKYLALKESVFSFNKSFRPFSPKEENKHLKVLQNPSTDGVFQIEHDLKNPKVTVYGSNGSVIKNCSYQNIDGLLHISIKQKGMLYLTISDDQHKEKTIKLINQ